MSTMAFSKSYLRLLIMLGLLAAAVLSVLLYCRIGSEPVDQEMTILPDKSPEKTEELTLETQQTEEKSEAPEPTAPAPIQKEIKAEIPRYVTKTHKVQEHESFSGITGSYWSDIFLWPDLYVRNTMRSGDPDLIYPNERVDIYNRLGNGDQFSEREKEEILESYLDVYDIYNDLGEYKNNSKWTLLWCGTKYDHNFLNTYADRIEPEDLEKAIQYVEEEGFLE